MTKVGLETYPTCLKPTYSVSVFFLIFYVLISSFTDVSRALGPNDGLRLPGAAGKGNGVGDKQQGGSRLVTVASRAQGVFFFGYSLLLYI